MAICIDGNFVCLAGGCFCQTADGESISFSGEAVANEFINCAAIQGKSFGFNYGGTNPATPSQNNRFDRYPYASDTSSTCIGTGSAVTQAVGHSSPSNLYQSGGFDFTTRDFIIKSPFSNVTDRTTVGNLGTGLTNGSAGFRSATPTQTTDDGFVSGGYYGPPPNFSCNIHRFPFSADIDSVDVGQLVSRLENSAGASSTTDGYHMGGLCSPPTPPIRRNAILKFPFSSTNSSSSDIGALTNIVNGIVGVSSTDTAYAVGGRAEPPSPPIVPFGLDIIQKFPFAAGAPASDVAELVQCGHNSATSMSFDNGYVTGGNDGSYTNVDLIQKFPFASDSPATDIGELSLCTCQSTGHQV